VPDLNGVWTDNGRLIVIVQSGLSLTSAYVEERICDHADGTGSTTAFRDDFQAQLFEENGVWKVTGTVTTCAYGFEEPSLNGVRWTDMVAELSADFNTMIGDWYNSVEGEWMVGGLTVLRQFEGGAPVPTPEGFTLPTAAP
jgi:hypothetical protein